MKEYKKISITENAKEKLRLVKAITGKTYSDTVELLTSLWLDSNKDKVAKIVSNE